MLATWLTLGAAADASVLTWSAAQNVDGTNTLSTIDCPSTTLCVAGDGNGNVITSVDPGGGAATWTVSNLVGGFVSINEVSCPSTSLCVAVDSAGTVWWSTDPNGGAAAWSSASINGGATLASIDCPSVSLCVAGGGNNGTMLWATNPTGGAGSWTPVVIDPGRGQFALSCPTTTFCVTGNDSFTPSPGVWWTTNPTGLAAAWTNISGVDSGANAGSVLEGMSCIDTTFCVGSDDFGNVVTSTNPTGIATDWTTTEIATFPVYWNVACPTKTLCVAAGGTAARVSTDPMGGALTWDTDTLATTLRAASCASAAFCVVGGGSGNIYVGRQATLTVTRAGNGNGTVTGPGFTCPPTCTLIYPIGTLVTAFASPAADGSTFAEWSGDCTGTGDCNLTMSADRAVTATFDPAPAPPATSASTPTPDPTPAQTADLPPPVQKQTANAYPETGQVLVQQTGSKKFVPLARPQQVRFGAVFDTTRGVVRITIADGKGGFDSATFSEGKFRLVAAGNVAELDLVGGDFKGCPKAARGGAAVAAGSARGRDVRHLWGEGKGAFRTKGRFASATIRGTKWLTDDYCRGTLIKVAIGAVTVRDLVKRKSVVLKAPKTYFARPRG